MNSGNLATFDSEKTKCPSLAIRTIFTSFFEGNLISRNISEFTESNFHNVIDTQCLECCDLPFKFSS